MEIVESDFRRSIKVRLEFTRPFKAVNPTSAALSGAATAKKA